MTKRAVSFDVDGCLFNKKYHRSSDKNVVLCNKGLLDQLKGSNESYSGMTTFLGSSRQSEGVDSYNAVDKGSCFLPFLEVTKYLNAEPNLLLLADLYENLIPGTSFKRAIAESYNGPHADFIFDETKLTLLYAQIHDMANTYSSEAIEFHFYDDKGNKGNSKHDILGRLNFFFNLYPNMIPKNVILYLHHYKGEEVTSYIEIQGEGIIDKNYAQTVQEMAYQVLKTIPEYQWHGIGARKYVNQTVDVAQYLDPNLLTREKPVRVSQVTMFQDEPIEERNSSWDCALQ